MDFISIEKVKEDKSIYPRSDWLPKTVERYADAMITGAKFPAIVLEKETNKLIDGKHRLEAYKKAIEKAKELNKTKKEDEELIDVEKFKSIPVEYHEVPKGMTIKYYAATLSSRHGDRLNNKDLEALAREEFTNNPGINVKEWGKKLGVSQGTIYNWISDILNKAKADRRVKVWRLIKLGWSQEEVGLKLGISQTIVHDEIIGFSNFIKSNNLSENWNAKGLQDGAEKIGIRETDIWAMVLDEWEDKDRFEKLDWGLRTWDNWYFNDCDKRFGEEWPGRIPAQLIAHTLYFFTNSNDIIFDPMAGGGTVSDTCLVFGRKCFSFDLSDRDYRPEIIKHYWNVDDMQFPEFIKSGYKKKINLVFFDPPYFSKKEKEYEEKTIDEKPSISSLSREKYLKFFKKFLIGIKEYMKPDGRIAFLNADWRDFQGIPAIKENPDSSITIFDYYKLLTDCGWKITHRISVPLSTERFNANVVFKMQEKRILGVVTRDLLIAKLEKNE